MRPSELSDADADTGKVSDRSTDDAPDSLRYQISAKQRHIAELEFQLQHAQEELRELQLRASGKTEGTPSNEFARLLHKKMQEVNQSPAVRRSKESIGNFLQEVQGGSGPFVGGGALKTRLQSLKPSGAAEKSLRAPVAETTGAGGFFGMLKDKLQELALNEEEESEFDREMTSDNFYLKDKLDYDSEEEVLSEEVDNNFTGTKYPLKTSNKHT
ncbi:AaceriACR180Wp [[Ashbya] aceris (nom. inval.)]|nr:AaceriACR180Wp [[Ashbya] aceris (nom. inval.)]